MEVIIEMCLFFVPMIEFSIYCIFEVVFVLTALVLVFLTTFPGTAEGNELEA